MARCPIVQPSVTRVALADGEYLDLKRELNAGEYRDMIVAQFKDLGEQVTLDRQMFGLTAMLAYIVGWSFVNTDGASPLPFSRDVLLKMDQSTYLEIRAAVEAHHEACEAAMAARKNDQAGGNGSVKTSA